MRYLVRARVKPGREADLLDAIERETLGQGSVAEGEYLRNMQDARLCADNTQSGEQTARWVEVCYCPIPLQEERPYWEEYFDLTRIQDGHDRRKCRDENGKPLLSSTLGSLRKRSSSYAASEISGASFW